MFKSANAGLGLFVLRVVVGLVFFMHGMGKLFGPPFVGGGMDGTIGFFTQLGIPMANIAAWGVGLVESLGGLALILGAGLPIVPLLLAIDIAVAILALKFKLGKGFGGGYEFELTLLAGAVCLMLSGPGILAVQLRPKNN